ncbi:MAG: hypothetical protein QG622_2046 [Actinomycetota bacterium]|nr:hypothetical protein [Actinomycetota bacterium]
MQPSPHQNAPFADETPDDLSRESRAPGRSAPGAILPGRLADPLPASVAQLMLARARRRTALPVDVISFVAACPACGRDCEWTQTRQETRVRSTTDCSCRIAGARP